MQEIIKTAVYPQKIDFYDAKSMAVTSFIPVLVIPLLLGTLAFELIGVTAAVIAFILIIIGSFKLRGMIVTSVCLRDNEMFYFTALSGAHVINKKNIKSVAVYSSVLAGSSLVIIVRVKGKYMPLIFFAGAMNTSAGGYKESIKLTREIFK